jgi:hypothetical protein
MRFFASLRMTELWASLRMTKTLGFAQNDRALGFAQNERTLWSSSAQNKRKPSLRVGRSPTWQSISGHNKIVCSEGFQKPLVITTS